MALATTYTIKNNIVRCTLCDSMMVEKTGRYGKFVACSNYPACKNIAKGLKSLPNTIKPIERPDSVDFAKWDTFSEQQKVFYNAIKKNPRINAGVFANAGTGKTHTIKNAIQYLPANKSIIFCAFNKAIATELAQKLPKNVTVQTLHSIGLSIIKKEHKVYVNDYKVSNIAKKYLGFHEKPTNNDQKDENKAIYNKIALIKQLVGLMKRTLIEPTKNNVEFLKDFYNIAYVGEAFDYQQCCLEIFNISIKDTYNIDFDDMLYFGAKYAKNSAVKYGYVIVDELQDMNLAQQTILRGIMAHDYGFIGVGDPNQAINGFTGAMLDSMDIMLNSLGNAQRFDLSVSFRCAKSHIAYTKQIVSAFEAHENNKIGSVQEIAPTEIDYAAIPDSALIIAATNSALPYHYYELLRLGKKAVIRGKDFAENLLMLLINSKAQSILDLEDYIYNQDLIMSEKSRSAAEQWQDVKSALLSIMVGSKAETIKDLENAILAMFDDNATDCIILSTIHKAKGLESEYVIVLNYDSIERNNPNDQDWQRTQQKFLRYVALTRSKDVLILVSAPKK